MTLILASSSIYRQQQLKQLGLEFTVSAPEIDETPLLGESAQDLVVRLAQEKAHKLKLSLPDSCVIGSDQVCTFAGQVCGKPHTTENAIKQLMAFSDNKVEFFTALCVLPPKGSPLVHTDITVVNFRPLSEDEIKRYIKKEQPLDCAGAFKIESLGVSLFNSIDTQDPSALMGLPLIKLSEFLRLSGLKIP